MKRFYGRLKKFRIDGLGWYWFFGVIDHFIEEIISWHIAKKGNRFAAMFTYSV
ncbi:hypothetical protein RDV77_09095 [Porphyromonadaceae sp. NP-X]|nr:hypothetical protein [Porphyromonadaceae sp. NP-X]